MSDMSDIEDEPSLNLNSENHPLEQTENQNISEIETYSNSLNLADNEKIIDIEVMNKKQLLIVISNSIDTYGAVYDIDKKTIISEIKK